MIIAVLALLGVDLIVIVAFLVVVLARTRWVRRQPGIYRTAARVAEGTVHGLGPKWRPGYGHWIHDVFVWTRAPLLFRTVLLPVDAMTDRRFARAGEVRRLGDHPSVVVLAVGSAVVEVRADGDTDQHLRGPFDDAAARPMLG